MTPQQWTTIRHFTPKEKWGDPAKMHYELLQELDRLRNFVKRPIIIHCGFEVRPKGWHPKGRAVDLHIEGLHPMEQFIAASRFKGFTGLGVYLWWHSPGLHVDNRPLPFYKPRALWGSTSKGAYLPFDTDFLKLAAALPWPPAEGAELGARA